MAFDVKGLKRMIIGGAVGTGAGSVKSLWMYVTNDVTATVETTGYFNTMAGQFVVGDQILASINIGASPVMKHYIVTANSGTVVTIAAQTVS